MFTIIGGDGKEYGPVSADQIRSWIETGRANLQTRARLDGTETWKALGEFAEFGGADPAPGATAIAPATDFLASDVPMPELAGRGQRLVAMLLDMLIASVACMPGFFLIGFGAMQMAIQGNYTALSAGMDVGRMLLGFALLAFFGLALAIVQIWMLSVSGQTIGKRIMSIRVVRYPGDERAGFVHAWLLRNFVVTLICYLPWIGFIFFFADYLCIFRADRRCLHDLIAATHVIKT